MYLRTERVEMKEYDPVQRNWAFLGRRTTLSIGMYALKNHPKVRIGNFDSFEQKMKYFMDGGSSSFMVVADFDYTLTACKTVTGDRCDITYGIFASAASRKEPHYRQLFRSLNEKYAPIESDTSLSIEQKAPSMLEWWSKTNDLIISAKFKQDEMLSLVKQSTMRLRSNGILYLNELERLRIPLIILSAGITNIIEASLQFELGRIPQNVRIVSNKMFVNEEGVCYKFSEPLIHSFSKNGGLLERCLETMKDLKNRRRIILLGDSIGDLRMVDGCQLLDENDVTVLKIGFCNGKTDILLETFVRSFDIVIVRDQTMDVLRHLNHLFFGVGEPFPAY